MELCEVRKKQSAINLIVKILVIIKKNKKTF